MNKILFKDANMSTTGIELANNADYKTPGNKFHMASQGLMANSEYVPQRFNTLTSELLERYKRQEVLFWPVLEIIPGAYYDGQNKILEHLINNDTRKEIEYYIVIRIEKYSAYVDGAYTNKYTASTFVRLPTSVTHDVSPDVRHLGYNNKFIIETEPYPAPDMTIINPTLTKTKDEIISKLDAQAQFFPYDKRDRKGYLVNATRTINNGKSFYNILLTRGGRIPPGDLHGYGFTKDAFKKVLVSDNQSPTLAMGMALSFPNYYTNRDVRIILNPHDLKDEYITDAGPSFVYKAMYKGEFLVSPSHTAPEYRVDLSAQ